MGGEKGFDRDHIITAAAVNVKGDDEQVATDTHVVGHILLKCFHLVCRIFQNGSSTSRLVLISFYDKSTTAFAVNSSQRVGIFLSDSST